MPILLVVSDPKDWPLDVPGVEVVSARTYIGDARYSRMRGAKVFNLCRHYRYQGTGYYVTLLAEARGHKPQPDLTSMQGFRSVSIAREQSEEVADLIQKCLAPLKSDEFELSIYFGRNLAQRYARLSLKLFNLFPVPLLRAYFKRHEGEWELQRVTPISADEVPESHRPFLVEAAMHFFERRRWSTPKRKQSRYSMAILHHPGSNEQPSNEAALEKFIKAAAKQGIEAELITRQDYARLMEYDALFIRETTGVNHHTYRFALRAESLGLVVIDDTNSILKCANKVYLAELLQRHGILTPRTIIVHRDNVDQVIPFVGLPCVLKEPDSAFSAGVKKAETEEELHTAADLMLARSDLIIGQEFSPTSFDWRVGVIDGRPLFVCKYFMADDHWQIVKQNNGELNWGNVESMPVEYAPSQMVKVAVRAANLIGDGLYGVDVKEVNGKFSVIEINDNPNIDNGYEDRELGDELYRRIIGVFLNRIERGKQWV